MGWNPEAHFLTEYYSALSVMEPGECVPGKRTVMNPAPMEQECLMRRPAAQVPRFFPEAPKELK